MTSRLFGLVRDQVLAYLFGAGNAMDAFNVAFRVPNLVRDLFAEGAMSAAFVPTFTEQLTRHGKPRAWRLGNQVINALLLTTGLLVLLGILFAEPLVSLFASEYRQVPGKLELTVTLTRLLLPFLTLVAVAVACMGMLNSLHHFFVPALSPAMFNLATIFCALLLSPWMPALGFDPIVSIAIGALVGGVGQIVLQWPPLRREGFRYRPVLDPGDEGLRRILLLMGPGLVGVAAVQINLLVSTILATGEGTGAVSWLNYAFRVMYLPIGLFGVSIATAAVPDISRHAARDELVSLRKTVSGGLRLMLMLNVPASVGLIALATPIVGLLFERGQFTEADTAATASALIYYAPGLLGYSAVKLAVPSFYALKDARTPVMASMLSVALNVVLNVTLVRVIGYRGLALGTGLAALVNGLVLLALLRTRLGGLDGRRVAIAFVKISIASAVMGVAAVAAERWLGSVVPIEGVSGAILRVFGAIAIGMATLGLAARLLGIQEFDEAVRRVVARLTRRSNG